MAASICVSSPTDAIGSVANFLVGHGWQRDLPIAFEAEADESIVDTLGRGIEAQTTWSAALAAGVVTEALLPLDTAVIVIDLPLVDGNGQPGRAYRVGTGNFSAILHYNRSYFYATAVTELAAAVRERMRSAAERHRARSTLRVRLFRRLGLDESRELHAVIEDAHQCRHVIEPAVEAPCVEDLRH